jgi:hypothetical protein
MDCVVLLHVVVRAVEGSRLRHLATVVRYGLRFPLLLVLHANPFLMGSSLLTVRCHVVELLSLLARGQMLLASGTVLEIVGLTLVSCTIFSTLVHSIFSRHREGGIVLGSRSNIRLFTFRLQDDFSNSIIPIFREFLKYRPILGAREVVQKVNHVGQAGLQVLFVEACLLLKLLAPIFEPSSRGLLPASSQPEVKSCSC